MKWLFSKQHLIWNKASWVSKLVGMDLEFCGEPTPDRGKRRSTLLKNVVKNIKGGLFSTK